MSFEENEVSKNAFGGTELTKRGMARLIDPNLLDHFQIICSRVRELKEDKIRIWWIHDTPSDSECIMIRDANYRAQFHLIVFTSDYQYNQFRTVLNVPYDEKHIVLASGVEPIDVSEKPKDEINLIYSSTPQRGLALLLPAVDHLSKTYPQIRLHVFSSFKMYGWDDMDKQYEPMYEFARKHPNMIYHEFSGEQSNVEVREQLKKSHIFAYPCIHPETFCRSVVEAMSAQALCVHPNYAALPFTTGGLNIMYPGSSDHNKHLQTFGKYLDIGIRMIRDEYDLTQPRLQFNKIFVDTNYASEVMASKWTIVLKQLLQNYPTSLSRAIPAPMFRYSTT